MTVTFICGDIRMLQTERNPELGDFDKVIQFLHWLTLFLVATVSVVALIVGVIPMSARAATAQTDDGPRSCLPGYRFEPGPIVNWHHRQPTRSEIEARTQELWAWSKTNAGSC
jgi:hypothetical protein